MDYRSIALGFVISIVVGHFVVGFLVSRMWRYLFKHGSVTEKHTESSGALSMPLGMLERALYTWALMEGNWQFIGLWLGLKTAGHWKLLDNRRGANNVWLIGTGLSLCFGILGAYIATWRIPQ